MSDIQFLVLLVTIAFCTAYIANVIYRTGKTICEHIHRAATYVGQTET